jgi:hypothetical protein
MLGRTVLGPSVIASSTDSPSSEAIALRPSRRDIDRTGDVLLLVLLTWKHFDELRALVQKLPNLVATNALHLRLGS